jgi:hypothetical protein
MRARRNGTPAHRNRPGARYVGWARDEVVPASGLLCVASCNPAIDSEDSLQLISPSLKRLSCLAQWQGRHVCPEQFGPGVPEDDVIDDPGRSADAV